MAKSSSISKTGGKAAPDAGRVCVGAIIGARGLRGEVRIKSFTADPADVGAYGPVETEDGAATFEVRVVANVKGAVVARLSGVGGRDAAEALKGTALYVARSALPVADDGAYYHADLIGLEVRSATGETLGRIKAVHNFGAGDVIEIEGPARGGLTDGLMVPFTAAAVPVVDVAQGHVVVAALPGLLQPADETAEG